MSKPYNPDRDPAWSAAPVPCKDCGELLEHECWRPGRKPSVCRPCQNKRYDAKLKGTPEAERRTRRRALRARLKRVKARLKRDQIALVQIQDELNETAVN